VFSPLFQLTQGRAVPPLAVAAFLAACLAGPAALASPALTGLWLDQSGRAGIDIEPCGASVCGTILWLKEPLTDAGQPKTDIRNTDASLHSRKICGMTMLYGFVPDTDGGWKNGFIYDPASGKTYNSNIHLAPDGSLTVRGYVEFTFLGKTQTWTRPPGPLPKCS
jgi:uncharacterized protein (DUF2147 family)